MDDAPGLFDVAILTLRHADNLLKGRCTHDLAVPRVIFCMTLDIRRDN